MTDSRIPLLREQLIAILLAAKTVQQMLATIYRVANVGSAEERHSNSAYLVNLAEIALLEQALLDLRDPPVSAWKQVANGILNGETPLPSVAEIPPETSEDSDSESAAITDAFDLHADEAPRTLH